MNQAVLLTGSLCLTDSEPLIEITQSEVQVSSVFKLLNSLSETETRPNFTEGTLPADEARFLLEASAEFDRNSMENLLKAELPDLEVIVEPLFENTGADVSRFSILRLNLFHEVLTPPQLFDVAYALRDELCLVSCEPDQSMFATMPERACSVYNPADELADSQWAVKNVRANKAHNIAVSKGQGILIGLPGCAINPTVSFESNSGEIAVSYDLIDGSEKLKGVSTVSDIGAVRETAMVSVSVGRQDRKVVGTAPNAKIVSIGCATSQNELNSAAFAQAIELANVAGCGVIVLGQTGGYCRAVETQIKQAIDNNIIVLAGAGDAGGSVSYPARYPGVITVGGSTLKDLPWEQTSKGQLVEFLAPAEFVWAASAPIDDGAIKAISGTALAAAIAAGGTALWLAHHGIDELKNEAAKRRCSLQDLFRLAVTNTARQPNNWDEARYGAGIIDCEALLKLPLENIPTAVETLQMFPDHVSEMASLVQENTGMLPKGNDFDFITFSPELSHLILSDKSLDGANANLNHSVSERLRKAIMDSDDKALIRLLDGA